MDRRTFIKSVGAAFAVAYVPKIDAGIRGWEFDPKAKYGQYVLVSDWTRETLFEAADQLQNHMRTVVPLKYRKDVTYILREPGSSGTRDPLEMIGSLSWKYTPSIVI